MEELKQIKNLFKKLIKDKNSAFSSAEKINMSRTSSYEKDKDFYKIYIRLEESIPFYTSFVEQKQDIDRSSTLYSLNGPKQFFHADVSNIRFFSKSAVNPIYALLCVGLLSSKVYIYPMKKTIM